jgi:hypothetical protein
MTRVIRCFTLSLIFVAYACLNGCATPAETQAMIVSPDASIGQNPKLKGKIALGNIGGGQETNPLWTSQVDNQSFTEALRGSLNAFGYLTSNSATASHKIDANLMSLVQPAFGLTLDVKSNIQYTVTTGNTSKEHIVEATGSAGFSDAAVAITRLRLANERSIKENITLFLKQLLSY